MRKQEKKAGDVARSSAQDRQTDRLRLRLRLRLRFITELDHALGAVAHQGKKM